MRQCACGCAAPLEGMRSDAIYASDACRVRAHKRGIQGAPEKFNPEKFWAGYGRRVAARAATPA